jgi:hypothetical protein
MTKLAEHSRIKLVLVLGHMGIDKNETADQLIGPKLACGISTKVAREVTRPDKWEALAVHSWTKVG